MSAVVKAIKSVVGVAVDIVEAVGDVVEDVFETVVETIEYVAENPEIIVIAVAAPQLLAIHRRNRRCRCSRYCWSNFRFSRR
jgi:hypothetical protein